MGTVYRGTQHSVGRDCAIKVVNPALVTEALSIKRFLRESKLASRLSHPTRSPCSTSARPRTACSTW